MKIIYLEMKKMKNSLYENFQNYSVYTFVFMKVDLKYQVESPLHPHRQSIDTRYYT